MIEKADKKLKKEDIFKDLKSKDLKNQKNEMKDLKNQKNGLKDLKSKDLKNQKNQEKETNIQEVVNHYFFTKGLTLDEVKENAKKKKIIYSRFTRPAKELIELAGSTKEAKSAISIVAEWANSRNLDYTIETVFKKWLELGRLKPKEVVKKPYFQNQPMVWSATKRKWFVIDDGGEWLEFAGKDKEIEWRIESPESNRPKA